MAAHLAQVEDQRQGVGQYSDHGEHHEGTALMNRGLLQVAVRGDGLEGLRVDDPTAATELMDELRRNRAQIHIRRIEVGAHDGGRLFFCDGLAVLLSDGDAVAVLHPNRLHDPTGR